MKYEEVYLHAYETISAAKAGLSWINTFASTTAAALTRALTGKHRISVTTIRCLYPWRPTPRAAYTQGRYPLIESGCLFKATGPAITYCVSRARTDVAGIYGVMLYRSPKAGLAAMGQ